MINERQEYINSAKEILNFLEANPEIELPFELQTTDTWTIFGMNKPQIIQLVKAFGTCEKKFIGDSFSVKKQFGNMYFSGYANRASVCKKIEKEVTIPEQIIPAVPEKRIEAHTKIEVEYICEPLLTGSDVQEIPEQETVALLSNAEEFCLDREQLP